MLESFNRAERLTENRFGHPVKQRVRDQVDVTLEAIYAYGSAPRVYYVEAGRGYTTGFEKTDQCSIAFGTGWFERDAQRTIRKLDMAVDLLRCTRYGATYMLPLGVVRLDGRSFWLVQYSGWDHERFVVIEVKKDNVVAAVSAWGGGC